MDGRMAVWWVLCHARTESDDEIEQESWPHRRDGVRPAAEGIPHSVSSCGRRVARQETTVRCVVVGNNVLR
jgi:hypothetical protein